MDLSPHLARTIAFRTVRKGYDPAEVDAFREQAATAIETAQNQATAMEARARAAIAKLQEATQHAATQQAPERVGEAPSAAGEAAGASAVATAPEAPAAAPTQVRATTDDAETISRTLLLAQRTAENTVAEAQRSAESLVAEARATAAAEITEARTETARLIDEAKAEARRHAEAERLSAENEVQALLARREFLVSDVEHLEQHIAAQRDRVRGAADALLDIAERTQSGLADARRPLLSASADDDSSSYRVDRGGPTAGEASGEANGEANGEDAPGGAGPAEPMVDDEPLEPTPVHTEVALEFGDQFADQFGDGSVDQSVDQSGDGSAQSGGTTGSGRWGSDQ